MTDPLDELIGKARLAPTAPYTDSDIDAAHQHLAKRIADRTAAPTGPCCRTRATQPTAEALARQRAEQELQDLCAVVVREPHAVDDLVSFVGDTLPGPVGGRVLGSILYLRSRPEAARFWWQYAAGDGDRAALYCLYLHHLAAGEPGEATWWYDQLETPGSAMTHMPQAPACRTASLMQLDAQSRSLFERMRSVDSRPVPVFQFLRILRALRVKWVLPDELDAVMDYVAAAVGWVDPDVELPLPDWDFTARLKNLTTRTPAPRHHPTPDRRPLKRRPRNETVPAN